MLNKNDRRGSVREMEKTAVLFFIITFISVQLIASKRNYKTCKDHNDPGFSACLEDAANIYFANLDEEIDGVHHSWKPVNTSINNGPLSVNMAYNITKFLNSTKSAEISLKYDASTKKLTGTISAPHVGYEVNSVVDGRFGTARLLGEGVATCHIWDMKASFETHLHIKPGTDTKFEMEEFKFKIDSIKNADIEISELRTKTKSLEASLRQVVRNFPDQIFFLAKDKWEYNLQLHYEDLTKEFLNEILDDGLVKND